MPLIAAAFSRLLQATPQPGRLYGGAITVEAIRNLWEATLRVLACLEPARLRAHVAGGVAGAVAGGVAGGGPRGGPAVPATGCQATLELKWLCSLIVDGLAPNVDSGLRLAAARWCRTASLAPVLADEAPALAALAAAVAGVPGQSMPGVAAITTADGGAVTSFSDAEADDDEGIGCDEASDEDDAAPPAAAGAAALSSSAKKRKRVSAGSAGAAAAAAEGSSAQTLTAQLEYVQSLDVDSLGQMPPDELLQVLEGLGERANLATKLLRATHRAQQNAVRALAKMRKG